MTDDAGFPLSVAQRRLWAADPQACGVRALRLRGRLDLDVLRRALGALAARHEALRTRFVRVPGLRLPLQVVDEEAALAWHVVDEEGELEDEARQLAATVRFDPAAGPAVQAWLLRREPQEHGLVLAVAALCADEASLDAVVAQLGELYAAEAGVGGDADGGAGDADPVQYVDFAGWQGSLADEPDAAEAAAFWATSVAAATDLAVRADDSSFAPATVAASLDPGLAERLADAGTDPGDFLAACWHALLWRHDQPARLAVGHLLDGRPLDDLEDAVGPYAQAVPVISAPEPDTPFSVLLEQVVAAGAQVRERQASFGVSGGAEVDELRLDAQFVWLAPDGGPSRWGDLEVESALSWPAQPPLTAGLRCRPGDAGVELTLVHDTGGMGALEARALLDAFTVCVAAAVEAPDTPLDRLPLLSAAAREAALAPVSETQLPTFDHPTLHAAIEAQAQRSPDRPAVEFAERTLTYAELVDAARVVAAGLTQNGVGPDVRVGICMERSADFVVAILGVLLAGGCYVPLDADYPPAYVQRILDDADARALITQPDLVERFDSDERVLATLDGVPASRRGAPVAEDVTARAVGPDNLVYVIYTSGSTGEPKGVEVTHRSALSLAAALAATVYAAEGAPLRVSLNAPFTFDASVKQIVMLAHGHTLHVLPGDIRLDAHALSDHLEYREVDVLDCTPSQLRPLLGAIEIHEGRERPRIVLVGGEAVGEELWNALRARAGLAAWNVYGPTETTVDATVARVAELDERPTIGRALPGVQALVLDAALAPVPPGVLGEVCIGGWGVARGYIGAPEATAAGFVEHPDPRAAGAGERLFRTGDLARVRGDGALEYLGRRDRQVKLRGFRIGLPEIEGSLARADGVSDVAVADVALRTGAKRLAAFVVAEDGSADEGSVLDGLRAHAEAQLPEHMRPDSYEVRDALPVTAHGKVDLARLREEAVERLEAGREYVAPRNPAEETLAAIWGSALETDRVGIHDNFFDVGGDSILQIVVVARAKEQGLELTPRDLYEHPTIAELAAGAGAAGGERAPAGS